MKTLLLTVILMIVSTITNAVTNAEITGMLEGYVENCNKKMTFSGHGFVGKTILEFSKGGVEQRRIVLRNSDEYKSGKKLVTPNFCITIGYLLEDMGLSKATTNKQ
ncbi:MAG TPA: hypothetical protein EYG35_00755 [Gammaproteobacteria bacterium]|nr:hypothetical protein [Gammaproteobacteria bacterium]